MLQPIEAVMGLTGLWCLQLPAIPPPAVVSFDITCRDVITVLDICALAAMRDKGVLSHQVL